MVRRRAAPSRTMRPRWCHSSFETALSRLLRMRSDTVRQSAKCAFAHPTKPSRQPYHFQQHRFAGIDQLFLRDARKAFAPGGAAARQRRDVDEGGEARAVVGIDGLDRPPAQIVAEI